MPTDTGELTCVRCGLEVRVNRDSYEIFERMDWVCFHFAFEHGGFDPDEECDAPGCPSSPSSSPAAAPCGLLDPDPAFQKLDTAESHGPWPPRRSLPLTPASVERDAGG